MRSESISALATAANDGHGHFRIHRNIEWTSSDFLQGTGLFAGPSPKVVPSWHGVGAGLRALMVPANPASDLWRWPRLGDVSRMDGLVSPASIAAATWISSRVLVSESPGYPGEGAVMRA